MLTEIVIAQPNADEIRAAHSELVSRADSIEIKTFEDHKCAFVYIVQLAKAKKAVTDKLNPIIGHAHKAYKSLTALRNELVKPIDTARGVTIGKLDEYEAEQNRIAAIEQRKAEEVARKAEEERLIQEALAAEEAGDMELAEEIINEPTMAPIVSLPARVAKVQGVGSQERWSAEIIDLLALVTYVSDHPEWITLLNPHMPALNALARSQRGAMRIPGVRATPNTVRTVRVG